jgi:hypothetical protein
VSGPFFVFGPRPFREARLRGYILREHRRGRLLVDILEDAYVRRCGSESFRWRVLQDPRTIDALRRDDVEAFARLSRELEPDREHEPAEG